MGVGVCGVRLQETRTSIGVAYFGPAHGAKSEDERERAEKTVVGGYDAIKKSVLQRYGDASPEDVPEHARPGVAALLRGRELSLSGASAAVRRRRHATPARAAPHTHCDHGNTTIIENGSANDLVIVLCIRLPFSVTNTRAQYHALSVP